MTAHRDSDQDMKDGTLRPGVSAWQAMRTGAAGLLTIGLLAIGLLAAGLLFGAGLAPQPAGAAPLPPLSRRLVQVTPGRWVEVRGERNHQQRAYRRLPASWSSDQKSAAAGYGFPLFRLRELSSGVTTEIWTYPNADVQLVFDATGRLVTTRLP